MDFKGLLDDETLARIDQDAGLQQALALMAASGPSLMPTNLGSILLQGNQVRDESRQVGLKNAMQRQQLLDQRRQQEQDKNILGMISPASAQQALAGGGGPTVANAEKLGQQPDKNRYLQAYAAALGANRFDLAREIKTAMDVQFPKQTYEKLGEGEQLIDPTTGKVVASGSPKGSKFTGAYGNLAIAMFGTDKADGLTPEQLQALDAEARKRQLERPPSFSMSVNMPSESERTAGFLTQRLTMGLQSLASAAGVDPKAASPNLGAELVKRLTGSEVLKNMANPAQRQVIEAAQLEVLDSALTLGTGAAYTREQLDGYRQSYFPQLGDTPPVVADKQKRLSNLLSAARIKAGRAAPEDVGLPAGVTVRKVQ